MFTYVKKKKGIKEYSMKIYVSQKIHPHEPVCSIAVIIQELPNGNHRIRVQDGGRGGPPSER